MGIADHASGSGRWPSGSDRSGAPASDARRRGPGPVRIAGLGTPRVRHRHGLRLRNGRRRGALGPTVIPGVDTAPLARTGDPAPDRMQVAPPPVPARRRPSRESPAAPARASRGALSCRAVDRHGRIRHPAPEIVIAGRRGHWRGTLAIDDFVIERRGNHVLADDETITIAQAMREP